MYRPEIDGLRAVAVVPVILFHAGVGYFSGGFVGVDIFFVISGYLITGILLTDLSKDQFSIATFYERRARRILPALFTVMLATLPFAWMWLLPAELKDFHQSVAAAALSVSNILFWLETDYFAQGTNLKLLLHTWSLGVEEQFYIFFPLLLLGISRLAVGRQIAVVGGVGLLSLIAAQHYLSTHTSMVFYLLPFRAWELALGALCAFAHAHGRQRESDLWAAIGLVLIVLCVLFYDKSIPFPGLAAVPPTLGTALLILYSGQGTHVGRLLSAPPLTFIGLLSYSAYLWHQPVLAFAQHYSAGPLSAVSLILLIALTFGLAYATWKYVETPFRKRPGGGAVLLPGRTPLLAASAAGIAAFVVIGYAGHSAHGFPDRFTPDQRAVLAENRWSQTCLHTRLDPRVDWPEAACTFNADNPRKVALVGDSVASSLAPALSAYFDRQGYALYQFTHSHCTLNVRYVYADQDARPCAAFVTSALDYIRGAEFDMVITTGNYDRLFDKGSTRLALQDRSAVDPVKKDGPVEKDGPVAEDGVIMAALAEFRSLAEGLATQVNGPFVLIFPHPRPDEPVRNFVVKRMRTTGVVDDYSTDRAAFRTDMAVLEPRLESVLPRNGLRVHPEDALCDATRCYAVRGGELYYDDTTHYSRRGAELVVQQLDAVLQANHSQAGH